MKVLLKKNITHLGHIGEVVTVKPGYARNYLLPCGLAVEPTEANVKAIDAEKERYLAEVAAEREATEAKASAVRGKEITLTARANEEGHLYGSIGPAQIAAALAEEGIFVEAGNIVLDEPIRQLDKYDVTLRFAEDVTAMIHVWVVPAHAEGEDPAAPEPPAADSPPEADADPQQVPSEP